MPKPKYELLREAYAIIGGIPKDAFNLRSVINLHGKSLDCGTIACAAGWLAMHPKFNALGLCLAAGDRHSLQLQGEPIWFDTAMSKVFGISERLAAELFGIALRGETGSHKEIWLRRVRTYLGKRGQLTAQLKAKAQQPTLKAAL